MGSICRFSRALPASIWGHLLSNPSFYQHLGHTKKGRDNDVFSAVFPSIWVSWDPQTLQNKGNAK